MRRAARRPQAGRVAPSADADSSPSVSWRDRHPPARSLFTGAVACRSDAGTLRRGGPAQAPRSQTSGRGAPSGSVEAVSSSEKILPSVRGQCRVARRYSREPFPTHPGVSRETPGSRRGAPPYVTRGVRAQPAARGARAGARGPGGGMDASPGPLQLPAHGTLAVTPRGPQGRGLPGFRDPLHRAVEGCVQVSLGLGWVSGPRLPTPAPPQASPGPADV